MRGAALVPRQRHDVGVPEADGHRGLEVEVSADDREEVFAHPLKACADGVILLCSARLERAQLSVGECSFVVLWVVQAAESDHARWIVVFALAPGRIKVMPVEVRTTAPRNRTPETNLATKGSAHLYWRRAIHFRGQATVATGDSARLILGADSSEQQGSTRPCGTYTAMTAPAVDDRARQAAARIQKPLLVAALLTIPATALQLSHVPEPWRTIGDVLNWVIWLAFVVELIVMLSLVSHRRRYLFDHPLEVAIVFLTPPFFLGAVQGIRILRLLRVLRLLRLAELSRTVFSVDGVKFASVVAILTAVAGGGGFASVENISFGNGVYWAITTMTTVGYGDISPRTTEGKLIAVVVMLVGIGTAALLIGAVAQRFLAPSVEQVEIAEDDLLAHVLEITARLNTMERVLRQRASTRRTE
jgi:voltage-gated potassium channel